MCLKDAGLRHPSTAWQSGRSTDMHTRQCLTNTIVQSIFRATVLSGLGSNSELSQALSVFQYPNLALPAKTKLHALPAGEFEELHSELRNARSQGGGVHGNAILSKFDFAGWHVLEHSHHPIDWEAAPEAQPHKLAAKEPRRGRWVERLLVTFLVAAAMQALHALGSPVPVLHVSGAPVRSQDLRVACAVLPCRLR